MSQEPKQRFKSPSRQKTAAISLTVTKTVVCPNCDATQIYIVFIETCGFYKGQQVIKVKQANTSQA